MCMCVTRRYISDNYSVTCVVYQSLPSLKNRNNLFEDTDFLLRNPDNYTPLYLFFSESMAKSLDTDALRWNYANLRIVRVKLIVLENQIY